jgi:hypothetical protein
MPRTREELEQAAAEAEAWLDTFEPDDASVAEVADLRAVTAAINKIAGAQAELEAAVLAARANGRSWGMIAIALGTSRQAARQRYEEADKDLRSIRKSEASDSNPKRVPWSKAKAELGLD